MASSLTDAQISAAASLKPIDVVGKDAGVPAEAHIEDCQWLRCAGVSEEVQLHRGGGAGLLIEDQRVASTRGVQPIVVDSTSPSSFANCAVISIR